MASATSRGLAAALSLVGDRIGYQDPDVLRRRVEANRIRPLKHWPPRRLDRSCDVDVDHDRGWPTYRLAPRSGPAAAQVVYLHGGAYIQEINALHWTFVGHLAAGVPASVTVPIYPVAPAGTAAVVVPQVVELVTAALADSPLPVVLMGDSAGAGLALAVAQRLRDAGGPQPAHLALVSPWVDATMSNPEIPSLELHDPLLSAAGLLYTAGLWAGDLDLADPLVSPINGDLAGLPPTSIVIGTYDVFHADARRFRDLAAAAGVAVDLVEGPAQLHDYPLLPTPEGRQAREDLIASIQTKVKAAG